MILADSAVWIDHLTKPIAALSELLAKEQVAGHPLVTAEVSLGSLAQRSRVIARLQGLYPTRVATIEQTQMFIDCRQLWSVGIGYVDANLLASVLLTPGTLLMTRDKRLYRQAARLGVGYPAS